MMQVATVLMGSQLFLTPAATAREERDVSTWYGKLRFGILEVALAVTAYLVAQQILHAPRWVRRPGGPQECLRLSEEAAARQEWGKALTWVRRAKQMGIAPRETCADEGYYLFELGLYPEALAFLAEAALSDPEGYTAFRAAQAASASARPQEEVLAWLDAALEKSPDLVGDLGFTTAFEPIRELSAYRAMVARAVHRLSMEGVRR